METPTRRPLVLGAAASVAAAPNGFLAYSVASAFQQESFDLISLAVGGLYIYFFGALIGAPIAFAFGLPYTTWLQRRGRLTWPAVCLGATLAGLVAFFAIWFLVFPLYKPLHWFAMVGTLSGFASGVVFCAVVQPNHSFKPTSLRDAA